MSSATIDVLIIGAGPVGLVLANELARYGGINFRIVEKNDSHSTWSKALMITSRTMNILDDAGLHHEILSKATFVEGLDVNFNQKPLGSLTMTPDVAPAVHYPFPTVLPQPDVEEAFGNVLVSRGVKIEWGKEVVSVQCKEGDEFAEAILSSGERIRAKYIVGCDGAHSLVRHAHPDWKFEGRPVDVLWAQCDGYIADPKVPTTRGAIYIGSTGFSIRLPLYHHERRFRVIVDVPLEGQNVQQSTGEFKYGRLEGKAPTLEEFNARIKATMGEHYSEVTDATWLTYFMVQERMVGKLRVAGRLFLAGDAAHCHSPAGGQGMNLGIQDAHNLAWKLALVLKGKAKDPDKVLDSYTAERIPIIRQTIHLTSQLVKLMKGSEAWYSGIIYGLMSVLISFKSVQRRAVPRLLQAHLRLTPTPNGILSTHTSKMIAPGERIPDPPSPVFCLTNNPSNITGTTHLMPLLEDSNKHTVLFLLGDKAVHEPHPILLQFASICTPYLSSVRPAILSRGYRMGGLRTPNWASKDITFLGTETDLTEKKFGLNGKDDMGVIVIRPDGYVAFSSLVNANGYGFTQLSDFLSQLFVKG